LFLRALDGPHRKGPFDSLPWLLKGGDDGTHGTQ
jgi:hypothetical protein